MFLWALFILYFAALSFLITRLNRKESTLSWIDTTAAFAFKIIGGCIYGWVHLHYYNGDDTWSYNAESIEEYVKLTNHPGVFFSELWPSSLQTTSGFLDYFFNNLERTLTVKLLVIFNFLSHGNYYINVIFFNFLLFWGHYWLFTFLRRRYPERRLLLIIGVFYIPTIIFWLSGIRGDGIVLFFLSLLFIQYEKWLNRKTAWYLGGSLLCLLGIFIFRSAVFMVLIPFLAGWLASAKFKTRPLPAYVLTYVIVTFFFFASRYLHPVVNLPAIVIRKQQAFMDLPGKTRFDMRPLTPDVSSFVKAVPSAVMNTFARPFPWEAKGTLQWATSVESILFLLFLLISLPFLNYRILQSDPWTCGMLFFCFSLFVFIGLTIPFPGAIIRYKAIPELLLLLVFIACYTRIK